MSSNLNYKGTLQLVNVDARGVATQEDSVAQNPVGCITRINGNLYRYVLFNTGNGPVASVAGAPAWLYDVDLADNEFEVTSDYSYGLAVFAGVLLKAAITTGSYVWIQIGGVVTAVVNSDTTVKGDRVFATTDATFTKVSQGTADFYATWGVLLEDRSATVSGKASTLLYPKMVW